jgi:hypothetical protein
VRQIDILQPLEQGTQLKNRAMHGKRLLVESRALAGKMYRLSARVRRKQSASVAGLAAEESGRDKRQKGTPRHSVERAPLEAAKKR